MDIPCSRCEKAVPEGTPMWSVSVQKEVFDGDEIEVHEAIAYHVFCLECAESLDFEKMTIPDKA